MDRDRVEGPIKEGVGKVEEGWGDVTNQPNTEAAGKEKQAEGSLQESWGKTKDDARDAVHHLTDDDRDAADDA
jgi:uncharacterized protein YjbJ (UPF0337 family)